MAIFILEGSEGKVVCMRCDTPVKNGSSNCETCKESLGVTGIRCYGSAGSGGKGGKGGFVSSKKS